jgi:hypothetical protein
VYQPSSGAEFTVTLPAGEYSCEWFDATAGKMAETSRVQATGDKKQFKPPFTGEAVLYLRKTKQ